MLDKIRALIVREPATVGRILLVLVVLGLVTAHIGGEMFTSIEAANVSNVSEVRG